MRIAGWIKTLLFGDKGGTYGVGPELPEIDAMGCLETVWDEREGGKERLGPSIFSEQELNKYDIGDVAVEEDGQV